MTKDNKKENIENKENKESKEKVYPKLSEVPQMLCEIYLAETQKKRENSTWYDNYYDDIKEVIFKYLNEYQKDNYVYSEDSVGNLMITPKKSSNSHIILSAHMDKVHTNGAIQQLYYDEKNGKMFAHNKEKKKTSLGADDKNGIYTILEMYRRLPDYKLPSIIFTVDEESGCKGSEEISGSFFEDKSFCIVIDRRNRHDLIYKGSSDLYGIHLPILFKKINPQYKYTTGSISDANVFREYCDCINISCGYYSPHSSNEYTQLDELLETCDAVEKFLLSWDAVHLSGKDLLEYKDVLDTPYYSRSYYSSYSTNSNTKNTTTTTTTTTTNTSSNPSTTPTNTSKDSRWDYWDSEWDGYDNSDDYYNYRHAFDKYSKRCPVCHTNSYDPGSGECWYCGYVGKNFKVDQDLFKQTSHDKDKKTEKGGEQT